MRTSGVRVLDPQGALPYSWGSIWGYANYSTRMSIWGRSGDPSTITPTESSSIHPDDFIGHNNPISEGRAFYQTPSTWRGIAGAIARDMVGRFDYRANLANDQLRQDYFVFGGEKHVRPADQIVDFRARKEIDSSAWQS
jgi:hypothetical protein